MTLNPGVGEGGLEEVEGGGEGAEEAGAAGAATVAVALALASAASAARALLVASKDWSCFRNKERDSARAAI